MSSKEIIKETVFRLLHENGFEQTTYQAVAEASGYDKTLVQYHFPQKILFLTEYLAYLISVVMEEAAGFIAEVDEKELNFIIHSKIYTGLLLHRELINTITINLVRDREVLTRMQDFQEQAALALLRVDGECREDLRYRLLFAQGGHFDLIYRMILGKREADVHRLLTQTLLTISPALKITHREVERIMEKSRGFDGQIERAVENIIGAVKSRLGMINKRRRK